MTSPKRLVCSILGSFFAYDSASSFAPGYNGQLYEGGGVCGPVFVMDETISCAWVRATGSHGSLGSTRFFMSSERAR